LLWKDNDSDGQTDEDCSTSTGTCTQSTQIVADGIDNDCDGRIDEELCNGIGTVWTSILLLQNRA